MFANGVHYRHSFLLGEEAAFNVSAHLFFNELRGQAFAVHVEQHALPIETPIVQGAFPVARFARRRANVEADRVTACLAGLAGGAAGANDAELRSSECFLPAFAHLLEGNVASAAGQMQVWRGEGRAIKSFGVWQHGAEVSCGSHRNGSHCGKHCDAEWGGPLKNTLPSQMHAHVLADVCVFWEDLCKTMTPARDAKHFQSLG